MCARRRFEQRWTWVKRSAGLMSMLAQVPTTSRHLKTQRSSYKRWTILLMSLEGHESAVALLSTGISYLISSTALDQHSTVPSPSPHMAASSNAVSSSFRLCMFSVKLSWTGLAGPRRLHGACPRSSCSCGCCLCLV